MRRTTAAPTMPMTYKAADYSRLRGLHGIPDEQVEVHLELYEGYVKRTNALLERLARTVADGGFDDPAYAELTRRLGWEWNGMRLHEFYFDGLRPGGGGALSANSRFGALVEQQFGSVEEWRADLAGVAKMPGIGWAITYFDPQRGGVLNMWVDQHHVGHPAGCRPLLVLDVWEHAYSVYLKPTERARYLDDFFANVSWDVVIDRLG